MSVSGMPSPAAHMSSRVISNFLAVQGMMLTTTRSLGSMPSFWAYQVLAMAPNICWGDLQLERLGMHSGYMCSQNLIQPGEQEVIMGSVPPFFTRSTNSWASSMMVRSAPKSVSYTPSNPMRRNAAAILPSTLVPMGIPKHSPRVARIEGAVLTMTFLVGSFRASHTFWVSSFSPIAPVGHTVMHCPQEIQVVSAKSMSKGLEIWVLIPRSLAPITPTSWLPWQTATQRRHRMHLLLLRNIW